MQTSQVQRINISEHNWCVCPDSDALHDDSAHAQTATHYTMITRMSSYALHENNADTKTVTQYTMIMCIPRWWRATTMVEVAK